MGDAQNLSDGGNLANSNKRKRVNELLSGTASQANPPATTKQAIIDAARAAVLAKAKNFAAPSQPSQSLAKPSQDASGASTTSTADRIASLKARLTAVKSTTLPKATVPSAQRNASTPTTFGASGHDDGVVKARGGLGIGLHPALLGDVQDGKATTKVLSPKFATSIGNRRQTSPASQNAGKKPLDLSGPSAEELKKNPYYDANIGAAVAPRGRKSRDLLFHQKGKFIAQAAALRKQALLEDMKKRIAESTRKANLDEDKSEQAFMVSEPPDVEWWDENLIVGSKYPDFEDDAIAAEKDLKVETEDSVITRYVQHPVLLQPPQEKNLPAPKPMFMTKTEQAKKRRQNRMEVLKEKQAKVRLGLEPPDPPKIKPKNMMNVLKDESVKNPTAFAARVNREVAERKAKHDRENDERKLTKEERKEKLEANQEKDASKGVLVCVFRIDSLAFGKHRYQIDLNAKQYALTGITILNPKLNLVIVEGGEHSINKYKKLMLQRIRWTDIASAPVSITDETPNHKNKDPTADVSWLKAEDESGHLRDQSENRCVLVWEGEEQDRRFKTWRSRVCETDTEARQSLERTKMENMWQLAKNWTG